MADYKAKTNWLPDDPINEDDLNRWEQGIKDANEEGDEHRNNKENPHEVTKKQIGLGNVTNDRQAKKDDFDAHKGDKKNPHEVTTEQVNVSIVQSADEPGSSYPNGVSMFQTANGVSLGYPANQIIVHTIRQGSHRCFQYIYDASTNVDTVWYRTWRLDNGWRDFVEAETVDGAKAKVELAEKNAKDASVSKTGDTITGTLTVNRGLVLGTAYTTVDGLIYFRESNDDIRAKLARGWVSLETEDGAAAKVKAHADQVNNPHKVTKDQVGLRSVQDYPIASKAQAESGNHTASYMTPLRTKEAIDANAQPLFVGPSGQEQIQLSTGDFLEQMFALPNGFYTFYASNDVKSLPNPDQSLRGIFHKVSANFGWLIGQDWDGRGYRNFVNNGNWKGWKEEETTTGAQAKVNAHANNKNNPHNVSSEQINTIAFKKSADLASTYPVGVSIFAISNLNDDVTGFPFGYGTVQTNRVHNSRTFQIFTGNGDTAASKNSWIRWAFENTWTGWEEYMSADTGWLKLPLLNGVKLHGTLSGIYIRKVGKLVQCRGAVTNILSDSTQITTLPSQFVPTSGRSLVGNTTLGDGTAYFVRYHLSGHNGALTMTRNSRGSAGYVDGLWYPLDFTWMIDD